MQTYTKREIAYKLNVSPRTVADDVRFLKLQPSKGDRGTKLYSQSDFNLISMMREHCADKSNSRESFVPSAMPEIIEDEPKISRLENTYLGLNSSYAFRTHADKSFVDASRRTEARAFRKLDPLYDLDLLKKIADNQYLLPTARLAPIVNLSPKYLGKLPKYFYCGFLAQRVLKENNQVYWKVQLCQELLKRSPSPQQLA